jgi:hypothetical protein
MKKNRHKFSAGLCTAAMLLPLAAMAAPTYVTCATPPWGEATNEAAMDTVFGAGNWTAAEFTTVNTATLFSAGTNFIFLEGGDDCATDFANFLTANSAALSAWVNAGGRAIINAAPNVGGDIDLGFGVTLNYGTVGSSGSATAAVPGHAIFNGPYTPVGTDFTGGGFAHTTVTGPGTVLINGNAPGPVLIEQTVGSGRVLFGAMTTTNFHDPQPEATNLRQNMLAYMSGGVVQAPAVQAVPTLSEYAMGLMVVLLGLTGMMASRRRFF